MAFLVGIFGLRIDDYLMATSQCIKVVESRISAANGYAHRRSADYLLERVSQNRGRYGNARSFQYEIRNSRFGDAEMDSSSHRPPLTFLQLSQWDKSCKWSGLTHSLTSQM